MPTYNDAAFRTQFPEFSNATTYPEALLSMYFGMAQNFIQADGNPFDILNGNALQMALNYMTAQLLVLGSQAAIGTPGSNQGGFETSASIGEISVQKLAPPASDMWTWWLAQTSYGQALAALLDLLAVGGFSVGGIDERSSFRKAGGVFY